MAKVDRPLIISELKSKTGKLSVSQRGWLEVLRRAIGVSAHLWRPGDWPEIADLLKR